MEVTSKLIQRLSSYNQRNKLTNFVTIFWYFTYNIHCFCCYGIESADSQKCIVISHRKSTADSPTFPSLHLRHTSFSNPSVAFLTSQLILQPFCCFTYVTAQFLTLLSLLLSHRLFTRGHASPGEPPMYLQHFPR